MRYNLLNDIAPFGVLFIFYDYFNKWFCTFVPRMKTIQKIIIMFYNFFKIHRYGEAIESSGGLETTEAVPAAVVDTPVEENASTETTAVVEQEGEKITPVPFEYVKEDAPAEIVAAPVVKDIAGLFTHFDSSIAVSNNLLGRLWDFANKLKPFPAESNPYTSKTDTTVVGQLSDKVSQLDSFNANFLAIQTHLETII